MLFWQLPPRRFWIWWCGGMHLLDFGIILAVLALGAIWTEQLTIGYFRYIDGETAIALHSSFVHLNNLSWNACCQRGKAGQQLFSTLLLPLGQNPSESQLASRESMTG